MSAQQIDHTIHQSSQAMPQTSTFSGENTLKMSQFQDQTRNASLSKVNINQFSGSIKMVSNNSSTGIRKIDRIHNQLVTQSMQNGITLKNIEGVLAPQIQTNSSLVRRERCESIGNQINNIKDSRNCKTSSPILNLQGGKESRLRKKSKDIKNREKFADLIVVLGIKYQDFNLHKRVNAQVVGGYPDLSDKEFAKKHNYVDNLSWICFPEGFVVQSFEKKKDGELCQSKIFHFIITNQDGDKRYITSILFKVFLYFCLLVQELYLSEKLGAFIIPKSICIVSSKPLFTLQKQLLCMIFQKVILDKNALSIQAYAKHPSNYLNYVNSETEEKIRESSDNFLMKKIEFYISIFFNHLYYCDEVDKDIEIEEIRERYTPYNQNSQGMQGNYKCGPNCIKKRHKHKEKLVDSYFRFRNTKTYGFTLENYSFELLLQCLKPERILFLITALLLERKIILIKENFGDIALIMESLVSLLNPLKWNFVFITYLTPQLVECLEAPFPYIIGVSKKVYLEQCQMRELPDDIIKFDIDNQELLNQVREELPPLPQPQANVLQRSLKDMLDIKERFIETIQENATNKVTKDKLEEYYWAYAQIRVKQSFFNFFLLTINNYIGYFKNLDEEGNLSPHKKDKQFYDKLSSQDVFDFDSYLKQFDGGNRDFMEKLVRTQSFNNFIEETYKNTTPKSVIGFFQTNLEVMIDHSFKKLKKEQNKLLDKTFFNLQNPVKFNIAGMYRHYKQQLLMKNAKKLYQILKDEGIEDGQNENHAHNSDELLQKLLFHEITESKDKQLSLLNTFEFDLITNMPGIQYDKISSYEQMKSQRSDQSQERRAHNKTQIDGKSMYGLDFQQSRYLEGNDNEKSDYKSRNLFKIIQSRSGDLVNKSQTFKAATHKRSGGGLIYDNFLSMANNQTQLFSQEDDIQNSMIDTQGQKFMFQDSSKLALQKIQALNEKAENKFRVNSENKLIGQQKMNKTMEITNNISIRAQAQTQQLKMRNTNNKSSTRNDFLHSSQIINPAASGTQANAKINKSPKVSDDTKFNQSLKKPQNSFHQEKQLKQQSVLKEALNRKIMHERQKNGLVNQTSENKIESFKYPTSNIQSNNVSSMFSPNNRSLANMTNDESQIKQQQKQNSKYIPNSRIDLMNPKVKKISRNEERKLAMKKGFLNPQQHESFSLFIYSPNEELNKLAMMQVIQRKVENGQIQLGQSKDQMSFSNLLYNQNNYNSNGSEEDVMSRLQRINSQHNQIQFQKRLLQDSDFFQANDTLLTTINFNQNFIQQKPQMHQSPSISHTEVSSIKKSDRLRDQFGDEEQQLMIEQNSPDTKHIKDLQSIINPNSKIKGFGLQSSAKSSMQQNLQNRRMNNSNKNSMNNFNMSVNEQSLGRLLSGSQKDQEDFKIQTNLAEGDENLDSIETKPLKILEDDKAGMTKTQLMNLKNPQILNSESPYLQSKVTHHNQTLSFKFFAQGHQQKELQQNSKSNTNQSTVKKNFNPGNRSPQNTSSYSNMTSNNSNRFNNKNTKAKQNQNSNNIMQTFDSRTDSNKKQLILNRKRSTPAINSEKSPQTNKQGNFLFKGGTQKANQEQNQPQSQQQSFNYFKQRPANQTLKSNKNSQIATTTVDLALKPKLADKTTARINERQDMTQLRISPIPNLSQILNQQKQSYRDNHNSSSGLSDDQVIIQSNNNRPSGQQNTSSNINPLSSNYASRQSNKSLNQNGDMMFASMSQLLDSDLFEKAHQTVNGAQTARNESNNKNPITTQKLRNQIFSLSQRSSSNLQNNFISRGSHLSGENFIRQSELSHNYDSARLQKDTELLLQDKLVLINSSRQSDILSQNEPQNNISISILKSSPTMMTKNISRTTKNMNDNQSGISRQNFVIQGMGMGSSIQQSVLTSQDTQNMKSILNALKNQVPQSYQYQQPVPNGQNINIVNVDLNKHKQVVFSPKGMSGQKIQDILQQTSTAAKMMLRNSSIEEVRRNINMSIESKKQSKIENRLYTNNSNVSAKKLNFPSQMDDKKKKQARSPQPFNNQLPPASNKALKTLQSQEYNLKEKQKRPSYNTNISNFQQSQDPLVTLAKDSHRSGKKVKQTMSKNQISNSKMINSSSKNLKIDVADCPVKDIPTNFLSSTLAKSNSRIEEITVSRSTKHLYGPPSKSRLLEEIDDVNQALIRLEEQKQKNKRCSDNLLEDTLTSQSNSNASYQTSPKHINNNSSAKQQIRGFQSSTIFKTINNQALRKQTYDESVHGSSSNINNNILVTVTSGQQLVTVRNSEFPIKNYQLSQHKESLILLNNINKPKYMQSTDELDYENQEITDFNQQMQFYNDESSDNGLLSNQVHHDSKQNERFSKIHQEIDLLMSQAPIDRNSRGKKSQVNRNNQHFNHFENSKFRQGAYSFHQSMKQRGLSQISGNNFVTSQNLEQNQPLNEIRQNQNLAKDCVIINKNDNSSVSSSKELNQKNKSIKSKGSENNNNSIHQFTNNSRHSHTVSSDNLPQDFKSLASKHHNRKRQLRHGMTTCFVFPAKESANYVRRDLNQDVFCKINSHIGDVDNDPHTPKSDVSFNSHDKNSRKKNRKKMASQYQEIIANGYQNHYIQSHVPLRMHSTSVDGHEDYKFQRKLGMPGSLKRRQDQEISKKDDLIIDTQKEDLSQNNQDSELEHQNNFNTFKVLQHRGNEKQQNIGKYEVLFDDADLKDTEDKFTSRDFNFNKLRHTPDEYSDDQYY
ncbi:UNKNOWN [Stylonychia lemnae]|uniref:UDENN domain-containing protein n=1 Tax=Stylonychia lemnae TaxID=5949 RepID=A0A078AUX9_STYLE|nr:UNKNOWN [Stylonychia lemnae]|eukprot:CDW85806.1 UNKNOWN [Stylonychia lemnae]